MVSRKCARVHSPAPRETTESTELNTAGYIKRRKHHVSFYSPKFWDNLSIVVFSHNALRELDRRVRPSSDIPVNNPNTLRKASRRLLRSDILRLKHFATRGGPDLSRLRGRCDMATVKKAKSSQAGVGQANMQEDAGPQAERSKKRTSAYDVEFGQALDDLGGRKVDYDFHGKDPPPPKNFEELQAMLEGSKYGRPDALLTQTAFATFKKANKDISQSESYTMSKVIATLVGPDDLKHPQAQDFQFSHLEALSKELCPAKPDIYYGSQPRLIDRVVRRDLDLFINPCADPSRPAVPNFFLEAKSPGGDLEVGERQAVYDNVLGARAMFYLQNYKKAKNFHDGNAYALAVVFKAGRFGYMHVYATYPEPWDVDGNTTQYFTMLLDSYHMGKSFKDYKAGVTAYHNARGWTAEIRDKFIMHANGISRRMPSSSHSFNGCFAKDTNLFWNITEYSIDRITIDRAVRTWQEARPKPTKTNGIQKKQSKAQIEGQLKRQCTQRPTDPDVEED